MHFVVLYRLLIAILGIAAMLGQIIHSSQFPTFNLFNHLSFFTFQSNTFVAVTFLISSYFIIAKKKPNKNLDIIRGGVVVYILITGLVYWLLLERLTAGDPMILPWADTLKHKIIPIAVLFDWVLFPPAATISRNKLLLWLLFPILWIFYSLIRGLLTGWYPYNFINPNVIGWDGFLKNILILSLGFVLLSLAVVKIGAFSHHRVLSRRPK